MHKIRPDVAAIVAYEIITIRLTLEGEGVRVFFYLPDSLFSPSTGNFQPFAIGRYPRGAPPFSILKDVKEG
jgi:hypothetical protein